MWTTGAEALPGVILAVEKYTVHALADGGDVAYVQAGTVYSLERACTRACVAGWVGGWVASACVCACMGVCVCAFVFVSVCVCVCWCVVVLFVFLCL